MINKNLRGRGAVFNPANRFNKIYIEDFETDEIDGITEEFPEKNIPTRFFKDDSKSIVAKNDSYDINFDYSFNPYRGCEHGCIYCYARPTHEFLGFSSGTDFESKIMIKEDAPKLLEKFFNKKNYKPDIIVFAGNTDCYQPVERKLKLTRKSLKVCLDYRNPVGLITKNSLIKRDIDIINKMAELNLVKVTVSITTLNKELQRKMEPRTSMPEKRLEIIKFFAEQNVPVGVNVAPIIPGLTDQEIPEILKLAVENGASFAGHILLRLPYAVKEIFIEWLFREMPDRADKIISRISSIRGGKLNESEMGKRFEGEGQFAKTIHNLFEVSCKKFGLNETKLELNRSLFRRIKDRDQIELF